MDTQLRLANGIAGDSDFGKGELLMTLTTLKGQRRAGISFGTRGRKLGDFFLELIPGADLEILTSAGVIMSALSRAEFK